MFRYKMRAEGFYPRNLQKVQVTRLEYELLTHQFCARKVDCGQIAEALSHYILFICGYGIK